MGPQQKLEQQEALFYDATRAILRNFSGSGELLEPLISALTPMACSYKEALLGAAGEQPSEDAERKRQYARQASELEGHVAFLTQVLRRSLLDKAA